MKEEKIDQLITAIEKLVDALALQHIANDDPAATAIPDTTPSAEPPKTFTHDDVKKYCLGQVRENPNFKAELAKALEGYGAKTLSQLKDDQLQVVAKMVGMK